MKKPIITLLVLQQFVFSSALKEIKIKDISSNRILSAAQDSTGFIWIGTDEGLNRYDGFSNKVYRSKILDEKTISGNRVWITHVDKSNTLWVGTDRGVCYYEPNRDVFYRKDLGSRPIHVLEHKEHIFFTTTNSGVYRFSKKDKSTTRYQFDPLDPFSLSSSKFSEKQKLPIALYDETAWIGTTNGLNKTSLKTGQTKRLYSGKTKLVKADTVTALLVVEDRLYVGTTKGLGATDLAFGESVNKNWGKAKSSHIINLFEIPESGCVGVVMRNQIHLLKEDRVFQKIKIKKTLEKITTLGMGQYLLSSKKHKNAILLNAEKNEVFYQETSTLITGREVFTDREGGVWVVGESGLVRAGNTKSPVSIETNIKLKDQKFTKTEAGLYSLLNKGVTFYDTNLQKKTIIENDLERSGPNTKIYVSESGKILLYDRSIDELTKKGFVVERASFLTPVNLVASKGNNLFISLKNSGIAHYNLESKKITDFRKNRLLSKTLPAGASSFLVDGKTLWVGSDESGLYEIDISNPNQPKLLKHHTHKKEETNSFSSSSVSCLIKHSGQIFVGTNGDGLFIYNKTGFSKISIEDGMPSNNVVSLSGSSDTTIWALTNGGLALVEWKEKNLNVVGEQEGLEVFYRSPDALIKKTNGDALVVSPGGVQEVSSANIYTNKYEASVVVESVELIDKNNQKHTTSKESIIATHSTPIIKINLTAPAIFKSERTTFSYFIKGYNDTWVNNGTRRYIELQGLDPGSYTIRIKSYNSDGYESKNTALITFKVVPPWWKTWWAYFLYSSTVLVFFAYYVGYQKRAQAKASEEKRKKEELEQARQFQLDMLPRETPDELGLDISATIETASEVGGDYYDYFPQKDKKSLYVVVGDATGHGMTAGMMVSITKAGLYGIPESTPPNDVARQLNRVIKNIDLGWNRMAFNMARFWDDRVEFTSAAMPPVYHYHNTTGELDEVLLGGLPLGSIKDESFVLEEFGFSQGDSLVFISDGLPEAENKEGEMLGYDAVYSCIKANGRLSADEQKQALLDLGSAWLGELQNQDDITIVVVKKSNPLQ